MDIFAHGLWTNIMYKSIPATRNNRKLTLWGIFFGILPDLISFVPVFGYALFASIFLSRPLFANLPHIDNPFFAYAIWSYNLTHSLVIYVVALIIVWLLIKKFPWVLLGWGLHVGIDILSHTEEFFATPFLYPLSDFKISAISWAHPVFMLVNYSLLLILYLFVIPKMKERKII